MELAALLGALAARGETAAEIAGFATAMREAATTLPLTAAEQAALVDTCGTGGDASGSFNISTAAALVAAAAGAKVAKHGNRAITSRCGSADVLEALGIPTTLAPEAAAEALRRAWVLLSAGAVASSGDEGGDAGAAGAGRADGAACAGAAAESGGRAGAGDGGV